MDIREKLPEIKENVSLAEQTTFKIGGPARYFFAAENKEDFVKAVGAAKEFELAFFILGGGSNILFSDKGFDGLVIKILSSKLEIQDSKIYVETGVRLDDLVKSAEDNSLAGLEWLVGIPGTVGGAVYGNAQAFGKRMSDIVEEVEALNRESMEIKKFSKEDCSFSLKNSIFKNNKSLIILSVVLRMEKGDKEEIQEKIKEYLDYRREEHPLDFPSAGSVFINPEKEPAGCLIEKCGLKGKKIGQAQISEKHANFIVNLGGAKAEDVLKLIKLAREKVKEKFGIELKEEIQII